MEVKPKKKFKRIYTIAVLAVLIILVFSFIVYSLNSGPIGPGPVEIQIIADKPCYMQGETVHFSIYINNTHDWRVVKPSLIEYTIGNSGTSLNINYAKADYFAAHSRTLFNTYQWNQKIGHGSNQTFVAPGNYTLSVSLEGPVDYGPAENCPFQIKP